MLTNITEKLFFVSVHTRNLAIPQVKVASAGQSIGAGTGYNK